MKQSASGIDATLVYLSALAQGLTLVSFPASSAVIKTAIGVSDAQYGAIFLPQVALAVIGAIAGAGLSQRIGLKALLALALLINGLSQALLAGAFFTGAGIGYPLLLAGTACLGLGFGLTGAPLNSYPGYLFPKRADSALLALHCCMGVGLTIGPVIVGKLVEIGGWLGFPTGLGALCAVLALLSLTSGLPRTTGNPSTDIADSVKPVGSPAFWILAAIAVLYAFAEGTFSSWAVIYVGETRQLGASTAAWSLSVFWGALVVGRLLISALLVRVKASIIWASLPPLMIGAFLFLPHVDTVPAALAAFAFAGLACSGFFPLTIATASARFPKVVSWVASMMTAALMLGVGVGSFMIGALKEQVPLEQLYELSALYPAIIVALIFFALRSMPRAVEAS